LMIERDTATRTGPRSNGNPRRPLNGTEFAPKDLPRPAGGRSTRETAAALFLSPKTVEYHLRHVYTKLAVHSREELSRKLSR
jgi:hypothetical protein